MAGIQLSGLASGLDWKSLVDQLMQIEATPINRMQSQQATNLQQSTALQTLGTNLTTLQTAVGNLKDDALFSGRTVNSTTTGSTWALAATAGVPTGSYQLAVSQIATKAGRTGAGNIAAGLAATSNVSGLTLATMRTAAVPTSGTFTVNGAQVTVASTDSLQDVFNAIATATGNDITASYDPAADKISLTSASNAKIVLGAANDTSNVLAVLKLANNDSSSVTSYGTLGSTRTTNTLASAGLKSAITAVDGTGAGTFAINGVNISYNVNTDTLGTLLQRINSSTAGVTATYDSVNDRVALLNNTTGDVGISMSESAGGVLGALGLTSGYTAVRGQNAKFSINGGPTIISASNVLDGSVHGVSGLSVTVDSAGTQTIQVGADTAKMKTQISSFIDAFNSVQSYIDSQTKTTTSGTKVTTSALSGNHDVQGWATQLRSLAFGQITGLSGTVSRLDDLGIDLDQHGQMSIKDSTKLDAALAAHPSDVEAFFTTANTGFAAKFNTTLTSLNQLDTDSQGRLTAANTSLDQQIADTQRRLDQQRQMLTDSFIAMETAQSSLKTQSTALANAFPSKSSS